MALHEETVQQASPLPPTTSSVEITTTSPVLPLIMTKETKRKLVRKSLLKELNATSIKHLTPRKQKLMNVIQAKCKSLRKLQAKSRRGQMTVRELMGQYEKSSNLIDRLTNKMSLPAAILFASQVRQHQRRPNGRRWTMEEKILALSIYKRSPKCYHLLRSMMALPNRRTLQSLLSNLKFAPGVQKPMFDKLEKAVKKSGQLAKYCVLSFDSMSVREFLEYDPHTDRIKGFVDYGEGERELQLADQLLVFMAKGTFSHWKQPLCFFLTPKSMKGGKLAHIIQEVVHACQGAGLRVLATVCDMVSVDTKAYELLGSKVDEPWFHVGGEKIVTLFDPPHILKNMRNALMKNDLLLPVEDADNALLEASWRDIEQAVALDASSVTFRGLHKITPSHLKPNSHEVMNVKLAAQVLSNSMAVRIDHFVQSKKMEPRAKATAQFSLDMNNIFDSLNGYGYSMSGPKGLHCRLLERRETLHTDFWASSIEKVKQWQFIKKSAHGETRRHNVPSLDGLRMTLRGMLEVWTTIKAEVPRGFFKNSSNQRYLKPRDFNQDPIENLFGCVRAGCGGNFVPSATQAIASLKTNVVNNLAYRDLVSGNCQNEPEPCELLSTLRDYLTPAHSITTLLPSHDELSRSPQEISSEVEDCFEEQEIFDGLELPDENISDVDAYPVSYVSGFILRKLFRSLSCSRCMLGLSKTEGPTQQMRSKEYSCDVINLTNANERVEQFIAHGSKIIHMSLPSIAHKNSLRKMLTSKLMKILDFSWFNDICSEHSEIVPTRIIQGLCRICIPWWCKLKNRGRRDEAKSASLRKRLKIFKRL